jgi:hypothetical protein
MAARSADDDDEADDGAVNAIIAKCADEPF